MGYLDKIRQVEREAQKTPVTDWLAAWKEVAALTDAIPDDDPRFEPVRAALGQCDVAFVAGDRGAFQRATDGLRQAVARPKAGCRIWWEGNRVNVPLEGPAVVLGTFIDSSTGELWCWFNYQGYDYLKLCRSISRWEPPMNNSISPPGSR